MQVFMWITRGLVAMFLIALAYDTFGQEATIPDPCATSEVRCRYVHHQTDHVVLYKGSWSQVPFTLDACDDEATALAILDAQRTGGDQKAQGVYIANSPRPCGKVIGYTMPIRKVGEHDGMAIWEIAIYNEGGLIPIPFYAIVRLPIFDCLGCI